MRVFALLLSSAALFAVAACGGSRNDPGMTDPPIPQATDSVSGTVTFKGAPLAGVTVTLWMTNTNSVVETAVTGSDGTYRFSGIKTTGNVPGDYHLWAMKAGFGFSPSVGSHAQVIRADHTGQFEPGVTPTSTFGIPMYLTVIHFVATANNSVSDANFTAYDGTNPVVSLAATGQQQSFAAGDDGASGKGIAWSAATRFTNNGDGTVTDRLTGLIWLQSAGCLGSAPWSAALIGAGQLASGQCGLSDGSKAGDWRLPNLAELESLVDVSASNPAVPAGSPFAQVSPDLYWTSTSYFGGEQGSPNAWVIRMSDGRYVNDGTLNAKTVANQVWAVRGAGGGTVKLQATGLFASFQSGDDGALQMGVPLLFPRFLDNGNGTVTDMETGLTWLKLSNCIQGDWATALASVSTLASGRCGLSDGSKPGDWRMPNRKEMQSLADRNQNNESDYLNYTFHNPDQSVFQAAILLNFIGYQYYWTSSTDTADPTQAWTVFSCDFGVYDMPKSLQGYTLAVR